MIAVVIVGGAMVVVARVTTFSSKFELRNLYLGLHEKLHSLFLPLTVLQLPFFTLNFFTFFFSLLFFFPQLKGSQLI